MQERYWYNAFASLILLGTVLGTTMAQELPAAASAASSATAVPRRSLARGERGSFGFLATLDQRLGFTPEQRDSVRGLLASQRQTMQSLREETDGKIRALLTPDQQKRFDALLAEQKARRQARFQRS
jgi:hypothetical protein